MGGTRAQPVGIQVWTVTAQPASALSVRSTESKRGGKEDVPKQAVYFLRSQNQ